MLAFMGIEDYVVNYGLERIGAKYMWNPGAFLRTNPIIRQGDCYGCCAIVPNTTLAIKMGFMQFGGRSVDGIAYDPISYNIAWVRYYRNDFVHTVFAPKALLEEFFSRPEEQIKRESGLFMYARSNDPYYIAATCCDTLDNSTEQINVEYIAELLVGCMQKTLSNIGLIESFLSDI